MLNRFSRTELLLGNEAMERLKNARVAVFDVILRKLALIFLIIGICPVLLITF